ncbi:MAG: YceI family protein [Planctomycetota bacterium]
MKTLLLLPAAFALFALPTLDTAGAPRGEHDWLVDPSHSSVVFRVKHANASWFQGTFDKIEGSVTYDPAKPEATAVTLKIPVDSVDTNDAKRDAHLKGGDFFDAGENPAIVFQSSKVAKKGEVLEVTGTLSMAGKSKEITIPVEFTGTGEFYGKRAGFLSTFPIKRSDFGMTYGVGEKTLGDEVALQIAIETIQAK